MSDDSEMQSLMLAQRWCEAQGAGWSVLDQAGRGGTAPVYGVVSPEGHKALKIYDVEFSEGQKGEIEEKRVEQQKQLGRHGFPGLVEVHDGGKFENRTFLLMNRAPGQELEKQLTKVPRQKIRTIIDQVARAALFLREQNLCHRDIKSANIFITDDFEHTTLLDLSVMRDINDPVGLGTDHGDRLPVVATARYSPPEYLFRLLEPGPEAWRALDVYQMGALLHDLIMHKPLFESDYETAKSNRYRFAWTVATKDPVIEAKDVDSDLLILARRALDKDWRRRLSLDLHSFLNDTPVRQERALAMFGFQRVTLSTNQLSLAETRKRLGTLSDELRELISRKLLEQNVRARHEIEWLGDDTICLRFSWIILQSSAMDRDHFAISVIINSNETAGEPKALPSVSLARDDRQVGLSLPALPWTDDLAPLLADGVLQALGELAEGLMKAPATGRE